MSTDQTRQHPSGPMVLPPPGPPRHGDSTRVIAIVALVVSVIALVVPVVMFVAPMLLFGAFAGGESFELGPEGSPEMMGPGPEGGGSGFEVPVQDGAVRGPALARSLREGPFEGEAVDCADVPRVREGATALCQTPGDSPTYVVVRFTDRDGTYAVDWFTPGGFLGD